MNYYCTYFDGNYLTRGVALYESLLRWERQPFTLSIMCMDERTYDALNTENLKNIELLRLSELECFDELFLRTKPNRTVFEHFAACKPSLMLYLLSRHKDATRITYLDADLFFFSDPEPLLHEVENSTVAVTPHRFVNSVEESERKGVFNAGYVSFSTNSEGIKCLKWWRERCMEWCKDIEDDGKYADQKYLEGFSKHFEAVHTVRNLGANVAPWNMRGRRITKKDAALLIDGEPVIFFHFHGLRRLSPSLFDTGASNYRAPITPELSTFVYAPYLLALMKAEYHFPTFGIKSITRYSVETHTLWARLYATIHHGLRISKRLIYRSYIRYSGNSRSSK